MRKSVVEYCFDCVRGDSCVLTAHRMENILENEPDKAFAEEVWEELLDSAIQEFCFDVKLNYLFLDSDLDPFHVQRKKSNEEAAEKDVPGPNSKQRKDALDCPNCQKKIGETTLGIHLPKCLDIVTGRTKSRECSRKKETQSISVDENESGAESSGKKKPKKTCEEKPQKSNADEEKGAFLKEKCDVLTKTNKRHSNSYKCTQHPNEDKELVRLSHLRNFGDHASNDQMDEGANEDDSKKLFT